MIFYYLLSNENEIFITIATTKCAILKKIFGYLSTDEFLIIFSVYFLCYFCISVFIAPGILSYEQNVPALIILANSFGL